MPDKKKSYSQKRAPRSRKSVNPIEGKQGFPQHLRKDDCIYIDGVVDKAIRGTYHVTGSNEMSFLCTARRMESLRVSIMPGDNVVIEIPLLGLEEGSEKQRGRLVWRYR